METEALNVYLTQTVGQQLLSHYKNRDAIRHQTPLLPVRTGGLLSLFGFGRNMARKAA